MFVCTTRIGALRAFILALVALLAALSFPRTEAAAAEFCPPVPEARTIEASLNDFWRISARLCHSEAEGVEALAFPEEVLVRTNRRWLIAMERRYGDWAVAGILAHEWGHIVQNRPYGTAAELQADCLAGAFLRAAGYSSTDAVSFAELSASNGDYEWRLHGHGTGAQRSNAVLRGYDRYDAKQAQRLESLCPFSAR